ncbi:hypothetical protein EVAR_61188_1 [Eumeta japonica]|uniref:Uncharacterized protein n=1 Tax=Eumeta variegata TaxID=151549 RepID=A0A4C1YZ34_EUMVA|nr:hypothetical protein EVAR_61188_1 [Eumeta japonica]
MFGSESRVPYRLQNPKKDQILRTRNQRICMKKLMDVSEAREICKGRHHMEIFDLCLPFREIDLLPTALPAWNWNQFFHILYRPFTLSFMILIPVSAFDSNRGSAFDFDSCFYLDSGFV